MATPFTIVFNGFAANRQSALYAMTDKRLSEMDVPETACQIGFCTTPSRRYNENYIEIIVPPQNDAAAIAWIEAVGTQAVESFNAQIVINHLKPAPAARLQS